MVRNAVMPQYVDGILDKLERAGHRAYAVGGCVRDISMGRRPSDWDIASSSSVDETVSLFRKTVLTGARFGTVTVFYKKGSCEVTTFRTDGEYSNGRSPGDVTFVSDIREDLSRRDFTVNAMAMARDGSITDPFGGTEDVKAGVIRCVGDPERRFTEDALRMLRALRFSAVLGFKIEDETMRAIEENARRAENLSAERIRDELGKIMMSERPEMTADVFKLGLMSKFVHGGAEINVPDGMFSKLPRKAELRWCALASVLFGCGAVDSPWEFLRDMRMTSETVKLCRKASESRPFSGTAEGIRAYVAACGETQAKFAAAYAVGAGDSKAFTRLRRALNRGGIVPPSSLAVNGTDLMGAGFSGQEIGRMLAELSEKVTNGKVKNDREALLYFAEQNR